MAESARPAGPPANRRAVHRRRPSRRRRRFLHRPRRELPRPARRPPGRGDPRRRHPSRGRRRVHGRGPRPADRATRRGDRDACRRCRKPRDRDPHRAPGLDADVRPGRPGRARAFAGREAFQEIDQAPRSAASPPTPRRSAAPPMCRRPSGRRRAASQAAGPGRCSRSPRISSTRSSRSGPRRFVATRRPPRPRPMTSDRPAVPRHGRAARSSSPVPASCGRGRRAT